MMIMRPPQQGHGHGSTRSSSVVVGSDGWSSFEGDGVAHLGQQRLPMQVETSCGGLAFRTIILPASKRRALGRKSPQSVPSGDPWTRVPRSPRPKAGALASS